MVLTQDSPRDEKLFCPLKYIANMQYPYHAAGDTRPDVPAFDAQHKYPSSVGRSGTVARISDSQSRETWVRIQCSRVERLKSSFDVRCFSCLNCMIND